MDFFGLKKHIHPKIFSNLLASWLLKRAKGKPFGLPRNFFLDTNESINSNWISIIYIYIYMVVCFVLSLCLNPPKLWCMKKTFDKMMCMFVVLQFSNQQSKRYWFLNEFYLWKSFFNFTIEFFEKLCIMKSWKKLVLNFFLCCIFSWRL